MDPVVGHLLLAAAWASFGVVHSLLASDVVKENAREEFRPFYRIFYNILAGAHLAGILLLEVLGLPPVAKFAWPTALEWLLHGVQIAGWMLLVVAVSRYDLGRFSGLTEAADELTIQEARRKKGLPRTRGPDEPQPPPPRVEPLLTGGLHSFVRHPLYTALFMILWGRVFNEYQLASAVWGSVYLVVGTRFEEQKLLRMYGEAYANYRERVPAFFPWRGRIR